jgi:hypothetical protein
MAARETAREFCSPGDVTFVSPRPYLLMTTQNGPTTGAGPVKPQTKETSP